MSRRQSLDLGTLRADYARRRLTPVEVVELVLDRIDSHGDPAVFLHLVPRATLTAQAQALLERDPATLPLYGIPFAVKDNIDLAGAPTTAACPALAYTPARSATVVARLVAAGALPIGKTNMDQLATGLVGTRSPYGVPRNPFDASLVPGGSSSGSGVAVATGLVGFALGTDTAGSGRVPAAFGNVVGLKPTRGLISTWGVVPACRTLDCVSIFALTCDDAADVLAAAAGFDAADAFSRRPPAVPAPATAWPPRLGVPRSDQRDFAGDAAAAAAFEAVLSRLASLGATLVEVDFSPFAEAAALLYDGPWLAERFLVVRELLATSPDALLPVTRSVIARGAAPTAADAFAAQYRLAGLRRTAEATLAAVDGLLLPTAPTTPRLADVDAEPIAVNAALGRYTNSVNLLDLAAVAVPAGFDARRRPFGVTLCGPAWSEARLLGLAARIHRAADVPLGATGADLPPPRAAAEPDGLVPVAVCGAHMSGLALNHELVDRGARLVGPARTAAAYRLYALPGGPPARPGLVRVRDGGEPIAIEVWAMPPAGLGSLVAGVPPPLAIGSVELDDGRVVRGFVCEAYAAAGARDVTGFGGWRGWLAHSAR